MLSKFSNIRWNTIVITALFILTILSVKEWFTGLVQRPLDPDEVVWMLDAEAVDWYLSEDWSVFKVSKPLAEMEWYEHEYRVIDQPQFGKYILGSILKLHNLEPWNSPNKVLYYWQFSTKKIPTGTLAKLQNTLDPVVWASIQRVREVNALVSCIGFCIAGLALAMHLKSKIAGLIFLNLLLNQSFISNYYHLAIVNPYSFFAQLAAVITIYFGHKKLTKSSVQVVSWGAAAGFWVAVASSIKLDGLFIFLGVWLYWLALVSLFLIMNSAHKKSTKKLLRVYELVSRTFVWLVSFVGSFFLFFVTFEPEIIVNGFEGFVLLILSRLAQQERFLQMGTNLSLTERSVFFGKGYFQQPLILQFLVGILCIWGVGKLYQDIKKKKLVVYKTFTISELLQRNLVWLIVGCVLVGSLYYSQVGFDRYIIPAVVVSYAVILKLVVSNENAKPR